jgi:hypothetical protein
MCGDGTTAVNGSQGRHDRKADPVARANPSAGIKGFGRNVAIAGTMGSQTSSISLSDLSSAGVLLSHIDAVTIARDAALRAAHGDLPGIPAPADLRLRSDGELEAARIEGGGNQIRAAGRLLAALLAHADQDVNAPATFRLILARAFAEDEAAYESLDEFTSALAPFAAADPKAVVIDVVRACCNRSSEVDALDEFASETPQLADSLVPAPAQLESMPIPPPMLIPPPIPMPPPVPVSPPRAADNRFATAAYPAESTDLDGPHLKPRHHSRRWIPAVAVAAIVAALLPALWSFSRSRSTTNEAARAHKAETPAPPPAAEAPKAEVVPSPQSGSPDNLPAVHMPTATGSLVATPTESAADRAPTQVAAAREVIRAAAFSPAFASTASGMFYHSGTGPRSAIMRADTDGKGTVLRVTSVVNDRGSNFHPRPSPDGQLLAFDSDRDGERGIYVADTNGQGLRRVSGPGFAAVPSWSPDGRRLAFVRAEDGKPRVWNIWTIDVATGKPTRITSHQVGQPWGAAWFPDGHRIAYSHEDRLIVRTLEGKDARVFKSPIRRRLVRTPAISPDGKRIIFQVRRDGGWILDVSTGSMHRVLKDPSAEEFTWSPDGRQVAYHSRRSGAWSIWVMALR